MGIVTGMLKLFFGTKSEKDRKEIEPYVEKIKAVYPLIEQLTMTSCVRAALRCKPPSPST